MNNFTKKELFDVADELAKSERYDSEGVKDLGEKFRVGLNSKNAVEQQETKNKAKDYLGNLVMLTLKQVFEKQSTVTYINSFANMFDDGYLNEGNYKQYNRVLPTGHSNYVIDGADFTPAVRTHPKNESWTLKMYKDVDTLADESFQFKKPLTRSENEWIPYFKSGALQEFIALIQEEIYLTWQYFKYDRLMKYIISTSESFQKQVKGTGKDMFEAMQELLVLIRDMTLLNNEFNIGDKTQTKTLNVTNPKDLIILMSAKNKQMLQSGIMTQLFNAQLLNFEGVINQENIYIAGQKLDIKTEHDVIDLFPEKYIDDNTIIVFDKKAFRFLMQLSESGTQSFPSNLTLELTLHKWGTMGYLPWYQGFVYKNNNLSSLPSSNFMNIEPVKNSKTK